MDAITASSQWAMSNDLLSVIDRHTQVRRDGRVVLFVMGTGFYIGKVERKETHDGKAWFWSRDGFQDECVGGHKTRGWAVKDMLETMRPEAK